VKYDFLYVLHINDANLVIIIEKPNKISNKFHLYRINRTNY